ncbi:UNVERIFIED_CONTAM: hypothetical protein K2H54_018189 [Gekko kuhli]
MLLVFQAPRVLKNEALILARGEAAALTNLVLDIRDSDNPQDVTVTVVDPPHHGQLARFPRNTLPAASMFKLEDLEGELVHYVHDGSRSSEDMAVLQVSDGYHSQNILFHIKIAPKNNEGPQLVTSSTVWVPEGGMLQITSRVIQAQVPGARDSAVIYTITDPPLYGTEQLTNVVTDVWCYDFSEKN